MGSGTFIVLSRLALAAVAFFAAVHGQDIHFPQPDHLPFQGPRWNNTWSDRLRRDLLIGYDKYSRPAQHHDNITDVFIDLYITHFTLDDINSRFISECWLHMAWDDYKLRWNSTKYGGLEVLRVADHEVWQPDIVLSNNAIASEIDHFGKTQMIVFPGGKVWWFPPASLMSHCKLNLRQWPSDTQTCYIKLGSWTYSSDAINLQILSNKTTVLEQDVDNKEWEVIDSLAFKNLTYYSCCPEPYQEVVYQLTIRRNSSYYRAVVTIPSVVVILLTLATFWLTPGSCEKLIVGSINLLILVVTTQFIAHRLPALQDHVPFVLVFYGGALVLVALSMISAVITSTMAHSRASKPPPHAIMNILEGKAGCILGLASLTPMASSTKSSMGEVALHEAGNGHGHRDNQHILPPTNSTADWILVAAAIDRLAFLFFCLLFGFLYAICM